ncbi:DNA polymerase III subunit gamma/tau [Vespertiliibacter pulmonis]|uniref:DNA polymerase III subunit gamma/tau n=1 Tax=Vespertiliibacter pulmonis TaxID=1443036 RepID=A0A3N4VT16_9PAST|nr:DNA polymerase III subunit gamma/tau [Vespertiliibacter pulmonis]QLB20257.1 DNA polymerase III subunit gamma/tau [Vespertiliibacter pulmonis]RPE86236.1 DNA polymerase III gamma subunit /DNA polymerase III tau subunit [Vespertiliibacter pulmonis]
MSYQVLARKWRPQRFNQVVGQQHVLSALENGLRENRLHHAYLFSGTRGVGKTSIARLFAKGLNCETGITADPCGKCANCKAIEEGRFIDLIEIDAASRTKVEDTRELLDNVQYKPTVGRFKVYLIDEVHMLSRSSFNALLKTLEEPPEYVKFLLATTDPQKLPITILSRCMQFHLRALDQSQIQHHLEFILKQENISYQLSAVEKLAKAAQGSIRDSLSLTDQAIAVGNGEITLPTVSQMLGLIDDHQPIELVQALALADGEKAMNVIQSVAQKGVDWQQLLSDVAERLHQIAMLQLLPHSSQHHDHNIENSQSESALHFLARQLPPEDVQFFYQLMLAGKKELSLAPEPRIGVEMTILRALAFHPKNADKIVTPTTSVVSTQPVKSVSATQSKIAQIKEQLVQNQQVEAKKTTTLQAVSSIENIANNVAETTALSENLSKTSPLKAATMALNALNRLDALSSEQQKKKREFLTPTSTKGSRSDSENLQARFAKLANKNVEQAKKAEHSVQDNDGEDYRWTWLNPELENQQEITQKPSDIKQAILQERTPELVQKTIKLASEQDEWCRIINHLTLPGLARQLALNSYLAGQQGDELQLVLKPVMAHLKNTENLENLKQALAEQGLNYHLSLGESNTHKTPLELRRQIFEQLTQSAKQALIADEKLRLLKNAFNAEIDESTIRAVAE